jgi:CRP-like cAMP-binding protein
VRRVVEHFARAPVPPVARSRAGARAGSRASVLSDTDHDWLRAVPLLADVPDATIQGVLSRGARLDVAAGEEVIRRWDSDRRFYIVLSGRYDVSIDARVIRTVGPGDHFGELAARDWGGGYGYARTATVRCAESGRLLRLTNEDFQWLVDTEPAVKARLAAVLAERLQQR